MPGLLQRIAQDTGAAGKQILTESAKGTAQAAKEIVADVAETATFGAAPGSSLNTDVSQDPEIRKLKAIDKQEAEVKLAALRKSLRQFRETEQAYFEAGQRQKAKEEQAEEQQQVQVKKVEEKQHRETRAQSILARITRSKGAGEIKGGKF